MNKGGAGPGPGTGPGGAGNGPTAAAAAAAIQKQKFLLQRADTDINSIVENFTSLVNCSRVNDQPYRNSQEAFQMEMRAARVVQSADSLLKLVSELKQTALFSGFALLNEHVEQRIGEFQHLEDKTDRLLEKIGEQAAAGLKELESHYYSSLERAYEADMANAQQPKLFVGMILILIFAEALALYGLIVGIILSSRFGQSRAQ